MEWFISNYGDAAGALAALVLFFDRLAKLTPTDSDNKVVTMAYRIFAVLGLKFPDVR